MEQNFSKNIFDKLQEELADKENITEDILNKAMQNAIGKYNQETASDFEGFLPEQMHQILYDPFNPDGAIKLNRNIEEKVLFENSPFYKLAKSLCLIIADSGKIKLTPKGNLPLRTVKDLYNLKILPDEFIEKGFTKLKSQDDWMQLCAVFFTCDLAEIVKKQKGSLSITQKGNNLINSDNSDLFFALFAAYTQKFNWAYFDRYDDELCGQLGFMFSLWLLKKYGAIDRSHDFYSDKYLTAFPKFRELDNNEGNYKRSHNCYKTRFLERFCNYFGFLEIKEKYYDKDAHDEIWQFKASSLLNLFIKNN